MYRAEVAEKRWTVCKSLGIYKQHTECADRWRSATLCGSLAVRASGRVHHGAFYLSAKPDRHWRVRFQTYLSITGAVPSSQHRKSQQSLRSLNQLMTKAKQSTSQIFTAALLCCSGDSPPPLPNWLLQAERSSASFFQFWCLVLSLRLPTSCLRLLPPSIPFYV